MMTIDQCKVEAACIFRIMPRAEIEAVAKSPLAAIGAVQALGDVTGGLAQDWTAQALGQMCSAALLAAPRSGEGVDRG